MEKRQLTWILVVVVVVLGVVGYFYFDEDVSFSPRKSFSQSNDDLGLSKSQECNTAPFTCPDGSLVYRDPANNCEYPACTNLITRNYVISGRTSYDVILNIRSSSTNSIMFDESFPGTLVEDSVEFENTGEFESYYKVEGNTLKGIVLAPYEDIIVRYSVEGASTRNFEGTWFIPITSQSGGIG